MFLAVEAMRYYRLWIYICNAVLFLSILIFCCAAFYILSDDRRHFITSVQLYHPSFLYAYFAILLQGGIIQLIGCIGALKLNERLLNTYWLILLGLLIGDVIVGGTWMLRLDHLTTGLASNLHKKLQTEYANNDGNFRHHFDQLQIESQCCGVETPKDYNATWWQKVEEEYFLDYERNTNHTDEHFLDDFEDDDDELDSEDILLPWSCCVADRLIEEPSVLANKIRGRLLAKSHDDSKPNRPDDDDENKVPLYPGSSIPTARRRYYILRKKGTKGFLTPEEKLLFGEEPIFMQGKWCTYSKMGNDWHYHTGCVARLKEWVESGADTLFVVGLCVVAFVKLTFLSILRYEIKEMIQKINLMQNETQQMNGELSTVLGLNNTSRGLSSCSSSSSENSPRNSRKVKTSNSDHLKPNCNDSKQSKTTSPLPNIPEKPDVAPQRPTLLKTTLHKQNQNFPLIDTSETNPSEKEREAMRPHEFSKKFSDKNPPKDTPWIHFRDENTQNRHETSVCLNNLHSTIVTSTSKSDVVTNFHGGSSRQTAI